jgi:hypothetical protein
VQVILAGYLLNSSSPEDPIWQLGVCRPSVCILALIPALWVIQYAWGRADRGRLHDFYVAFDSPTCPRALAPRRLVPGGVRGLPPWPWTTLVLVSAVLGWWFCEANREGAAARARYFRAMAVAGVLCLLAFVAYDVWMHTPVRFGFMRDFIVNRHWIPRGVTLLWVGAVLFCTTPAAWYLMDHRGWAPRWLVELGQTAMLLYFIHQIIVFTIVKKWLGVLPVGLLGRERADGPPPPRKGGCDAAAPPPSRRLRPLRVPLTPLAWRCWASPFRGTSTAGGE